LSALSQAREQLASNVKVLDAVLPEGTLRRSRTVPVHIHQARNLFGLEVDLHVTSLAALKAVRW